MNCEFIEIYWFSFRNVIVAEANSSKTCRTGSSAVLIVAVADCVSDVVV